MQQEREIQRPTSFTSSLRGIAYLEAERLFSSTRVPLIAKLSLWKKMYQAFFLACKET